VGRHRDVSCPFEHGDAALIPLCVDLDGTLIKSDVLYESAARLLAQKPWLAPMLPVWLLNGRAAMKRKIAEQVSLDPSLLPYNEAFIEWIAAEKSAGRRLVLATASDILLAEDIEKHLVLFDEVLGSDGHHNLKGAGKLERLKSLYGTEFAYAGNSKADLAVWRQCREAIVVNANAKVLAAARANGNVSRVFEQEPITAAMIAAALQWKQWVWNLLIFAAPLALRQSVPIGQGIAAYFSFGFCGSAAAILGDLLALRHITTGAIPIAVAFTAWPVLFAMGAGLALFLPLRFAICVVLFSVLTALYSRRTMISPIVMRLAAGWFAFVKH
jgi:phosphoserine phosphatase